VAHLDLKLENLLLGDDYGVKIADFDLSYKEGDSKIKSKGTAIYGSPEILEGSCTEPMAADLYSLGLVLLLLATGGSLDLIK